MIQNLHIISRTPITTPHKPTTRKLAQMLAKALCSDELTEQPEAIEIDLQRAVLRSINEIGAFETLRAITNFVGALKSIPIKRRSVQ